VSQILRPEAHVSQVRETISRGFKVSPHVGVSIDLAASSATNCRCRGSIK
jgi:hypothetical protein